VVVFTEEKAKQVSHRLLYQCQCSGFDNLKTSSLGGTWHGGICLYLEVEVGRLWSEASLGNHTILYLKDKPKVKGLGCVSSGGVLA
jgi:hypothetical protein